MKKLLIVIIGIVLLLGVSVVVLRWRREAQILAKQKNAGGGPAFEVRVDRPIFNGARPPWEIPGVILGLSERGPKFDQTSSGAKLINVGKDRLELIADGGWNIYIAADDQGRIASGTHLQFPITLGSRPLNFDCRPAANPSGHLDTSERTNSGEIDGSFFVDVVTCINTKSGKTAAWPYEPLTIRGSFSNLSNQRH
jgi:hypothetical protein